MPNPNHNSRDKFSSLVCKDYHALENFKLGFSLHSSTYDVGEEYQNILVSFISRHFPSKGANRNKATWSALTGKVYM